MKKTTDLLDKQELLNKNFGLSRSDFEQLLTDLAKGEDTLVRQVFTAHFGSCMSYLQQRYEASHTDAYDATMDTLLLFCDRLRQGKVSYGNLRFLFSQMAAQHYVRLQKKTQRTTTLPETVNFLSDEAPTPIPDDAQDALDQAWQRLGPGCQHLLKAFYYDNAKLKDIAQALGKKDTSLRKQKERCLRKLQELFQQFYTK